jgi:hypothetical protein
VKKQDEIQLREPDFLVENWKCRWGSSCRPNKEDSRAQNNSWMKRLGKVSRKRRCRSVVGEKKCPNNVVEEERSGKRSKEEEPLGMRQLTDTCRSYDRRENRH